MSLRSSAPTIENLSVRFLAGKFSRLDRKASEEPSGDHRGEVFEAPPVANARARAAPFDRTSQICELRRSPAGIGVSTTKATMLPSGEICGSRTCLMLTRSMGSKGLGSGAVSITIFFRNKTEKTE